VTNLPFFLGSFENLPDFAAFDDIDSGIMKLVEIDAVGLQAFETFLEHTGDVGGGKVSLAAVRSNHDIAAFGCEYDLLSSPFQCVTQQCFGISGTVRVRGINEIYAQFECCIDSTQGLRIFHWAKVARMNHCAKTDDANTQPGSS